MSRTKIDNLLRLAIYDAYRGLCFYTGEPVAYQDFEVDHIIPESCVSEVKQIKKRLKLGDDFHINSIENLVPSRPGINLNKNNLIFSDNTLLFYFEKTKAKKARVIELYENYKNQNNRSNGYKAIDKILLSGNISLEDIDSYIHCKIMEKWKAKKVNLNYPIHFTDGDINEVAINDCHKEIMVKALELFEDGRGVELIDDNGKIIEVHTLTEWKEYTNNNFYPYSNADIRMSGTFEFLDGLILALDNAQMPKVSFVEGLSMKDLILRFSSSTLVEIEGGIPNVMIGELIKKGDAEIIDMQNHSVCIRYGGFLNTFSEQFRADFTNDGIENIFCYVWRNADGGTMGWGETMIMRCHSKYGIVEEEKVNCQSSKQKKCHER